jgi:hypothetical protein
MTMSCLTVTMWGLLTLFLSILPRAMSLVTNVEITPAALQVARDSPEPLRKFIISNRGKGPLTILGYSYYTQPINQLGGAVRNTSLQDGTWDLDAGFYATSLPFVGVELEPDTNVAAIVSYDPDEHEASDATVLTVWTSTGSASIEFSAVEAKVSRRSNKRDRTPNNKLIVVSQDHIHKRAAAATTTSKRSTSTSSLPKTTPKTTTSMMMNKAAAMSSSASLSAASCKTEFPANPTPGVTSCSGWKYVGCANDVSAFSIRGAAFDVGSNIQSCLQRCTDSNMPLAGVKGGRCLCGYQLEAGSKLGGGTCNLKCAKRPETCGGDKALSVFNFTTWQPPDIAKHSNGYDFKGCYDEASGGRILTGDTIDDPKMMSAECCTTFCKVRRYNFCGMKNGSECWCGKSMFEGGKTGEGECKKVLCSGNKMEFCGSKTHLTVYQTMEDLSGMSNPHPVKARGLDHNALDAVKDPLVRRTVEEWLRRIDLRQAMNETES